jgi:hypothetical protein
LTDPWDYSRRYEQLLDDAVGSIEATGSVDLVTLADAISEGFEHRQLIADAHALAA